MNLPLPGLHLPGCLAPHVRASKAAATLVEVVVTIGILVTMLVPLTGMLSLGLATSGKAVSNTVGADVASHLMGQVQQADWSQVSDWDGVDHYYDDQGERLAGESAQDESCYTARIVLSAPGVTLGTAEGAIANDAGRQAVILVACQPGPQGQRALDKSVKAMTEGDRLPRHVRASQTLLVNLEKE